MKTKTTLGISVTGDQTKISISGVTNAFQYEKFCLSPSYLKHVAAYVYNITKLIVFLLNRYFFLKVLPFTSQGGKKTLDNTEDQLTTKHHQVTA